MAEKKPFQSRFLPNHQTKKEETESSSEEESSTEASEDEDDNQSGKKSTGTTSATSAPSNRSSQARDAYDTRRSSRDEPYSSRARLSGPSHSRDSDDARPSITQRTRHSEADDLSTRAASNG